MTETDGLAAVRPEPAAGAGADNERLVRASAVVALGTLLSRLTGLARVGVMTYAIGRATLADTYNLANTTPNIVYELLLGGVLSATLVPLFVEKRDDDRAISAVATVSIAVLVAVTAAAVLAAPWIARLYTFRAPGVERAAQREVTVQLLRLFLPQMCFYGLTTLATALLHARRRFAAAAYAPVLNNLVVVAVFLAFAGATDGPRSDWVGVGRVRDETGLVTLLGLGTTAGIAVMSFALLPALHGVGVRLRPIFDWRHEAVRRLLRLSGWTAGYVVANQLALAFVLVLASARSGGVSAYQYAFIFFQLPHGLFAVSIMTTVTPELARHTTRGDAAAFRTQFAQGLRHLVVVVVPAAAALAVLAQPLVAILVRGGFGAHDARVTADALQLLALGLPSFSLYLYTLRGFYAYRDTRTPFLVNCFENAANVGLAALLFPRLGVQGLAMSYSCAYLVASLVALRLLRRRAGGLEERAWASTLARAATASVLLAAVAAPVAAAVGSTPDRAPIAAGLAALVGGCAYLFAGRLLGLSELESLHFLRRRRSGRVTIGAAGESEGLGLKDSPADSGRRGRRRGHGGSGSQ